jgi:hypothetical protein
MFAFSDVVPDVIDLLIWLGRENGMGFLDRTFSGSGNFTIFVPAVQNQCSESRPTTRTSNKLRTVRPVRNRSHEFHP